MRFPPRPMVKPNLLDRIISHVSPERGLRRLQARAGIEFLASFDVAREAGSRTGTMSNWVPMRTNRWGEGLERQTIVDRAQDLVANDSYASGAVDSLAVNIVGYGVTPRSQPNDAVLGISDEQAEAFSQQAEHVFLKWSRTADIRRKLHFEDIQFVSMRSMFMNGEFTVAPLWSSDIGRPYNFALQTIDPLRLKTPADMMSDERFRDGVETANNDGAPTGYWIANPDNGVLLPNLTSANFIRYPSWRGFRPGFYHGFYAKDPEQMRGVSVLAPAMKAFRDLHDYLDYELVANIVTAASPLWIETPNPADVVNALTSGQGDTSTTGRMYQDLEPGQIAYGRPGEKPHLLTPARPSVTFDAYVERILRSFAAATGQPYEVLAKDFSKTNYSSARAALLEAWRLYNLYRRWLVRHFCQPVYECVLEEAFLRGELVIPTGAPDFYDAREAWCQALWIGPPRGHVDPLKEVESNIEQTENNMTTLSEVVAEQGGDYRITLKQRAKEKALERELGLTPPQRFPTDPKAYPSDDPAEAPGGK